MVNIGDLLYSPYKNCWGLQEFVKLPIGWPQRIPGGPRIFLKFLGGQEISWVPQEISWNFFWGQEISWIFQKFLGYPRNFLGSPRNLLEFRKIPGGPRNFLGSPRNFLEFLQGPRNFLGGSKNSWGPKQTP